MGLDTVELVIAIEDEFGIQIPDAVAANMFTPNDVADFVIGLVEQGDEPAKWTRAGALARILEITAKILGVPRTDVLPHSRFIDDLNAQ